MHKPIEIFGKLEEYRICYVWTNRDTYEIVGIQNLYKSIEIETSQAKLYFKKYYYAFCDDQQVLELSDNNHYEIKCYSV